MKPLNNIAIASLCMISAAVVGAVNARADNAAPTINDAHELIGELVARGNIFAYSDEMEDGYRKYNGDGCNSIVYWGRKGAYVDIKWKNITVVESDSIRVAIRGALDLWAFDNKNRKGEGLVSSVEDKRYFVVRDEPTIKRLRNAMNFLMESCAKKTKFD